MKITNDKYYTHRGISRGSLRRSFLRIRSTRSWLLQFQKLYNLLKSKNYDKKDSKS